MSHQRQEPSKRPSRPHLNSRDTGTSSKRPSFMVETLEHRRFIEFCDACRRYRYIGLCFGAPGVGKTLSARSYSRCETIKESERWTTGPAEGALLDTVFYTPSVVNTPRTIDIAIRRTRDTMRNLAKRPLRLEK